jgi:hypothetical protein
VRRLAWCIILVGPVVFTASADQTPPDPDDWYQNQYAPVWKDHPWEKLEEFMLYFDESIGYHSSDKAPAELLSRAWLAESLAAWRSEGWVSSEVAGYRSDRLNAFAITFKAKWRDEYEGGVEEFSCGWYMADFKEGRWIFTQYADLDCAEHNL